MSDVKDRSSLSSARTRVRALRSSLNLRLNQTTASKTSQFFKKVIRWLIAAWWFYPFGGAAVATFLVLIHFQPSKASITLHLAERLAQILVIASWGFAALAWRSLPRDPDGELLVVAGKGATEVLRIWRRGMLLVPVWLATAIGHMVAHYRRSPKEGAATFEGFLTNIGTDLEQQMLGLQALFLIAVLVGVAIENGLQKTPAVIIRPHLVAVAFLATLASSLSEVTSLVSPEAFLTATHVSSVSAWSTLIAAVGWAARVNARTVVLPVLDAFSEVAAVAAVTVLVTGVALGLDWTDQTGIADLTGTFEGRALIAKAALGALLVGVLGYLQRRFALPRLLGSEPSPKTLFLKLGAVELAIMAVAVVLGVAL